MRAYLYGLITVWAVTFVFAVPMILLDKSLTLLMILTGSVTAITALVGIATLCKDISGHKISRKLPALKPAELIFLGVFLGLVLFQLYKCVFFAYADGDDAYYVATSQVAAVSDRLYRNDPYTGIAYLQSKRYFLAPFPLWVAMIAKITGLNASAVSHVMMPVALIPATYIIYSEIGKHLFKDNREARFVFLCLLAVFAMFSGYSISGAERFMLTRTRQGKEALGNIIIPGLFMCIADFLSEERTKENDRRNLMVFVVLGLAGALTSFFSNLVFMLTFGLLILLILFKERSVKKAVLPVLALIPEFVMFAVYILI